MVIVVTTATIQAGIGIRGVCCSTEISLAVPGQDDGSPRYLDQLGDVPHSRSVCAFPP